MSGAGLARADDAPVNDVNATTGLRGEVEVMGDDNHGARGRAVDMFTD